MLEIDVKIGMRVVPKKKTITYVMGTDNYDPTISEDCLGSSHAWADALVRDQEFLYVKDFCIANDFNYFVLNKDSVPRSEAGGDFFLASDFEPYCDYYI